MTFGISTEIWVVVGLGVLVIMFLFSFLARLYRKAGPHEALIVYGVGGTRVVKGHGIIVWPMVQVCRELSIELMSFDVAPQQDLYTKQGVAVTVEAVAQIKVKSDVESILTASEQFLTKADQEREGLIRLVMEGHLRGIIGQLTVEEIVKQPEMVGDRMRATCADDMISPASSVMPTWPPPKPIAIRLSSARSRSANPRSRERRPTRNACWQKRCRRPSRLKRNATSRSRERNISKSPRSSRRRPTRRTTSRQTSCSSR